MLPILSLFSGAGGLDLGFRYAGFESVLAIDFDQAAVTTYRSNFPDAVVVKEDLSDVEPSIIADLWQEQIGNLGPVGIIGGPPCQGYSSSNVHQTDTDPRRKLLFNYANVVTHFLERFQIDFFAFENVPGLLRKKHRGLFDEFKSTCSDAGFDVSYGEIDAGSYGIAQCRNRLIVTGVNRMRHSATKVPIVGGDKEPLTVESVLRDLPEPVYFKKNMDFNNVPFHRNHVTMVPRSSKFTDGSLLNHRNKGLSFKVLSWLSPSYTVAYGHNEIHIHPRCHRRLSIYEAMLLQGFPAQGYYLHGNLSEQVKLISDAVPPPLGEGVARNLAKVVGFDEHMR